MLILGDIHGEWHKLNTIINKKKPEIILQVGDFGYWPNMDDSHLKIKTQGAPLYFCDGNHEYHEGFKSYPTEIAPNVWHMPRGSVLEYKNKNILFMGGAESIDKGLRTPGYDWFPQESITYVPNIQQKIDIVISHTCPSFLCSEMQEKSRNYGRTASTSNAALSLVYDQTKPDLWFFGHWHQNATIPWGKTKFIALNMAGRTGWHATL